MPSRSSMANYRYEIDVMNKCPRGRQPARVAVSPRLAPIFVGRTASATHDRSRQRAASRLRVLDDIFR